MNDGGTTSSRELEMFKKFDLNRDGVLNVGEFSAALAVIATTNRDNINNNDNQNVS